MKIKTPIEKLCFIPCPEQMRGEDCDCTINIKLKNMEELKQRMADKMLSEKLDFLPLKESLDLEAADINLETRFYWVGMVEEVEDNGNGMTNEEIIEELVDIYGNDDYALCVGTTDEFDEFTYVFCPAPTYIDLIK